MWNRPETTFPRRNPTNRALTPNHDRFGIISLINSFKMKTKQAKDFLVQQTAEQAARDRKSTRLNSSHGYISYAVFCLKKKQHNLTHRYLSSSSRYSFPRPCSNDRTASCSPAASTSCIPVSTTRSSGSRVSRQSDTAPT